MVRLSRAVLWPGPDLEWADRIVALLEHKGEPWNWQNQAVLRDYIGLDVRFFILHKDEHLWRRKINIF
jgi:hypothetical protein